MFKISLKFIVVEEKSKKMKLFLVTLFCVCAVVLAAPLNDVSNPLNLRFFEKKIVFVEGKNENEFDQK